MYFLNINGKEYVTAHNKSLITFLRDELNLTGTKDAENADWVLVDGVKTSARSIRLGQLKDKQILTIEGVEETMLKRCASDLSEQDSGFFWPGHVISAIGEGALRAEAEISPQAFEKLAGKKVFADDVNIPRQVYVRPIFARYPHANITGIDMSRALENVRFGDCILKADIPGSFPGMLGVGDTVQSPEEIVALVATTYLEEMDVLCSLIDVAYDGGTAEAKRERPSMPECATALYNDDDTLTVYSNGSFPDEIRSLCAQTLALPETDITIIATPVEGAKSGRAEVCAALTAWLTQQPVKVKF